MTRVKICGIRSVADCLAAVQAGADAVGMLVGQVHASDDFISIDAAIAICGVLERGAPGGLSQRLRLRQFPECDSGPHPVNSSVPRYERSGASCRPAFSQQVVPVVVTHLTSLPEIMDLVRRVPCRAVQVHSEQSPGNLQILREELRPCQIIGKVSIDGPAAIDRAQEIAESVDAILLDSIDRDTNRVGGTGQVHDWCLSARIAERSAVPVILAGGLNPENVRRAIQTVKPWGVDVNTGVKGPDGRKCCERMSRFVAAAKSVDS